MNFDLVAAPDSVMDSLRLSWSFRTLQMRCILPSQQHMKLIEKGPAVWNNWYDQRPDTTPDLHGADLSGRDLQGIRLNNADLCDSDLRDSNLTEANLRYADLRRVNLTKARLTKANISGGDLRNADLREANFSMAILRGADLAGAQILMTRLCQADLVGAYLAGVNLRGAILSGANLRTASLGDAVIANTGLQNACLRDASLRGAILSGADLRYADLRNADLTETNLTGARLFMSLRDKWRIENVRCNYIFLDEEGEQRYPANRNFKQGEFQALYSEVPTFEYMFENDMHWLDAAIMDYLTHQANAMKPELGLRLRSIEGEGIRPCAVFEVLTESVLEEAREQITTNYSDFLANSEVRSAAIEKVVAKATALRSQAICELVIS